MRTCELHDFMLMSLCVCPVHVCVSVCASMFLFLHLISPAMKKAHRGPKSPRAIYSGQQAEWQTSLNQHATTRGNLKTPRC